MKRMSVFFLFVLTLSLPTTLFSGGREGPRRIIEESRVTSRRIIEESSRHPRYHSRHHGGRTDLSVHAEAGFYYEPYYGPQYYPRHERRVVVADSSCGGLLGLLFGDVNDSCGRKAAAEARKVEAEANLEIRKAELQRDILLRGPGAFGGEGGSIDFDSSHLGSGGMTVERGGK